MRSYLILGMCGLFLIQYFVHVQWLEYLVIFMALAAFMGSATKADPVPRWFGICMLMTGIVLEFQKGRGIDGVSEGVSMNLPLLTLVILVPLLSIPLKLGGYFDAIDTLLRGLLHHPRKLFAGITSVLFVLGPILNLGSIRIVDELLKGLKLPPVMLAKSYLVGFSTTMLWSPYYASVALILYYLKIPTIEYMAYGIGFALLFILIGNVLFAFWSKRHPLSPDSFAEAASAEESKDGTYRRKLVRLGLIVAVLMSMTFLLETLTHWSMLVIVSLLSISFPLCWVIITGKWSLLRTQLADFRDRSVPIMNNEILLFTSAGLLGNALQGTAFGSGMKWALISLAQQSFFIFEISIIVTVVVVAFIGIHPMVIVTALVTQMDAQALGTTPIALAILLMLAWSTSAVLSPVNPLNLLVSRLSGITGLAAGVRANGIHLLIVAILGLSIITIIQ
ncbi:hypothetical protein [Paenibacillus naphthalenovorans]|uniref:Uncharacterized protein n=1 Tax=Paenibacillus naphthalenovorans TaxID=162209 RepID=A0A0U2VYW3_9BACL|nr:hypothetical protein [Paenibacillus naphthalenovorans]ALS20421.1 hypothetical protein IJ22_00290 [Paenibacillus naphthalenovorans]